MKVVLLRQGMYDPKIARFLQEDTYGGEQGDPLSLNRYTYCLNNPLRYYDPTGHISQEDAMRLYAQVSEFQKKKGKTGYYSQKEAAELSAIYGKYDLYDSWKGTPWNDQAFFGKLSRNDMKRALDGYSSPVGSSMDTLNRLGQQAILDNMPKYKSSAIDPVKESGRKNARKLLDRLLEEPCDDYLHDGDSLYDLTWGAEYERRYLAEKKKDNDFAELFAILDFLETVKDGIKTVGSQTGYEPVSTTGGVVAYVALQLSAGDNNGEPGGVSDLLASIGLNNGSTEGSIAKARAKSTYINNSEFKYLVYSDGILWFDGPREQFIHGISKLEKKISSSNLVPIYKSSKDNQTYKQALLQYLKDMKQMNIHYDKSVADMRFMLDIKMGK